MSAALGGNLKDFGIAEVFQLIGQQGKTGLLEISAEAHTVRLAFDRGRVVWGAPVGEVESASLADQLVRCGMMTRERANECLHECETSARTLSALLGSTGEISPDDLEAIADLLTKDTIFQVLRWSGGSFHFSAQAVVHQKPPEKLLAAEQILMDGLRMVDEWQTFIEYVPNTDVVFERRGSVEQVRQGPGGPKAERVFGLVDGRLTVRRVIDLSRLGTFEATQALAELHRTGLIQTVSRTSVTRFTRKLGSRGSLLEPIRAAALAVVPVAILGLVVLASLQGGTQARRQEGFPIVRSPIEEAHYVFEKRRLRNALQAERFLTAGWPDDLQELHGMRALGGESLARAATRPYYYTRHEDGVLLLAPER